MTDYVGRNLSDGLINAPVGTADVVAVKDIMLFDLATGTLKRASSMADQLTEEDNQRLAARLFRGVAQQPKTAAQDWVETVMVDEGFDSEYVFDCVSETHAVGDWMAIDEAASGTALENQKLVKTTEKARAIFECVKKDAAVATRVTVRRLRQDVDPRDQILTKTLAADLTLTKNTPRVLFIDPAGARKILLPPEADMVGVNGLFISNEADAAEDITVRDDGDAATIATISQGEAGTFACNGVAWRGGVLKNT